MDKPALGLKIQELRSALAFSQRKLAAVSGVAYATIQGLEKGAGNPTLDTMAALARALKCPFLELLAPLEPINFMRPHLSVMPQAQPFETTVLDAIGALKADQDELTHLREENVRLKAQTRSLPDDFWQFWQNPDKKLARAVFLYALLRKKQYWKALADLVKDKTVLEKYREISLFPK